ncbi:MAG: glycerate kinase [Anaerolineae bacterium]|nr:glycerate kinase [Anaerolineae bacterium]
MHFKQPDARGDRRRSAALEVLGAALDAVDPAAALRRTLHRQGDVLRVAGQLYDLSRFRRVLVAGAGKAAAPMAQAVEEILGDRISGGALTVKYGYTAPTQRVTLHQAGHPVPDSAGVAGAQAIVALLEDASPDDLVLCLISGGGSALMPLPVPGVALGELQALTNALLRSGAPIQALNAVRKHLSQVSGGQLARLAHPATVLALIVSDVVGSPLDVIASGPTVADSSTFQDAWDVLARYDVLEQTPPSIRRHLERGLAGEAPETVKPGDPALERVRNVIVADNALAAEAAEARARALGFNTLLLSTYVEGEAREVGRVLAALAREIVAHGRPLPAPACLLLGGETTVTVRGAGKGGRNQELALASALAIQGMESVLIASLATDGSDGPTDAAGGLVDGATVARGEAAGHSAFGALAANDAYHFLEGAGDLLVTGPTNTNVNDLMTVFVGDLA